MKIILVYFLILCLSVTSIAQEYDEPEPNQREAGLNFIGLLTAYGATFKFGTTTNMWRVNSLFGTHSAVNSSQNDNAFLDQENRTNIQFSFGHEFRKAIEENLEFRYGADISFGVESSKETLKPNDDGFSGVNNRNKMEVGLNAVVGLNYVFNGKLVLGGELLPGVRYFTENIRNVPLENQVNEGTNTGFNIDVRHQTFRLSLAYRF